MWAATNRWSGLLSFPLCIHLIHGGSIQMNNCNTLCLLSLPGDGLHPPTLLVWKSLHSFFFFLCVYEYKYNWSIPEKRKNEVRRLNKWHRYLASRERVMGVLSSSPSTSIAQDEIVTFFRRLKLSLLIPLGRLIDPTNNWVTVLLYWEPVFFTAHRSLQWCFILMTRRGQHSCHRYRQPLL